MFKTILNGYIRDAKTDIGLHVQFLKRQGRDTEFIKRRRDRILEARRLVNNDIDQQLAAAKGYSVSKRFYIVSDLYKEVRDKVVIKFTKRLHNKLYYTNFITKLEAFIKALMIVRNNHLVYVLLDTLDQITYHELAEKLFGIMKIGLINYYNSLSITELYDYKDRYSKFMRSQFSYIQVCIIKKRIKELMCAYGRIEVRRFINVPFLIIRSSTLAKKFEKLIPNVQYRNILIIYSCNRSTHTIPADILYKITQYLWFHKKNIRNIKPLQ